MSQVNNLLSPNNKEENVVLSSEQENRDPSPTKQSKVRSKYAGVQSKVQSGIAMKPPVPNFAANRARREEQQKKADRLAPSKWLA